MKAVAVEMKRWAGKVFAGELGEEGNTLAVEAVRECKLAP